VCCRGHTSYVNSAIFTKDGAGALTASSDGSVRLWDVKTTESLLTFRPGLSSTVAAVSRDLAVHTMKLMPNNPDHLLVCMKGPQAFIMTVQGQVVRSFSSGKLTGGDFVCATTSPQGVSLSLSVFVCVCVHVCMNECMCMDVLLSCGL
jgi:WD40 repeat-containing protein SMU1